MKQIIPILFIIMGAVYTQSAKEDIMADFKLTSTAFEDGATIPVLYTCDGKDISPPLAWSGVPAGTRSFALTCVDPDAPMGDWIHWVAWDIPAANTELKAGIPGDEQILLKQGTNSWGMTGYGGPCPPHRHGPHRYYFTLYALDVDHLPLDDDTRLKDLQHALEGHVLAEATLMGRYERP
jgi:hypothetical protein